jgi:hypothetical protein
MMKRIHLFEIHEQPWCPSVIRDGVTSFLSYSESMGNYYGGATERIKEAMRNAGTQTVIDLGSGSGGPWPKIYPEVRSIVEGGMNVVLTDKFPNESATKRLDEGTDFGIRYHKHAVDIREVPVELDGFRTIFTAFHHFPPRDARAILEDAVSKGQGIGIFEFTGRQLLTLFLMLLAPLNVLLLTPFIRPFRWGRILWTYLIPVIPFVVFFDGLVSCMRTYSPAEMRELVSATSGSDYEWDIGQYLIPFVFMTVTYTIGYPRTKRVADQPLVAAATSRPSAVVGANSVVGTGDPTSRGAGDQPRKPEPPRKPR